MCPRVYSCIPRCPGDIGLRYSFIWWGARSKFEVGYMGKKWDFSTFVIIHATPISTLLLRYKREMMPERLLLHSPGPVI